MEYLKYVNYEVTFAELPDEITLCVNISNCPCHCEGCHSPYLAEDIGEELSVDAIEHFIDSSKGITAICFMGGDSNQPYINTLAKWVKENRPNIKVGWYSGRPESYVDGVVKITPLIDIKNFDYIKVGPYIESKGPLNNPNTNQKLYQVINKELNDITYKFWKK